MKNNSLNRAYRLVWNDVTQCYQPAPETARGRGKSGRSARVLALACASLFGAAAWAGPTGGTVSAGSGSISQSGSATTVTQGSQNLAINWASFSIGANESVNFVQPNASAIALNRVTGSESSVINGALNANGQVWILNANGVLFGKTASINVGGLVASTLNLSDEDFMAGKTSFTGDGSQGTVVNQGSLSGGYVALLGKQVSNSGTITTTGGTTALAAGDAITLSFSGSSLLSVQVDAGTYQALAENSGLIQADDGTVLLSATAKDALLDTVVNNTGIIQARGISTDGGSIVLLGGFNGGTVNVAGTLDASSTTHDGGFIETSGAHVLIADDAKITTLSATGQTGTWLVDPTDFTISAGAGAGSGSGSSTSGIGADTLNTLLASNNVTLETDNTSGTDSGDINVNAAVSWSANTTLTLNAHNNININAAITATGSSAGLVFNYGGDYAIAAPVTLSGANASLTMNGQAYTLIHSMSQLDALDGASGYYALAEDLDASGTTYTDSVVSGTFSGTFTGLGHTVSNLQISASSKTQVGLFSTNTGTLRDLGVTGGSITGYYQVGALVGTNNGGKLYNVFATADVQGTVQAGGLVGGSDRGDISQAYATGSVSGNSNVGGLAGYVYNASATDVYATGNVTGTGAQIGGVVGYLANSSLTRAYATGNVSAGNSVAGGVVGQAYYSTVSGIWASGQVTARQRAGGLIGNNDYSTITNGVWDSGTSTQSAAIGRSQGGTTSGLTSVTSSTAYSHSSYANLGTWTETASGSGVWVATSGGVKQWVMIEGSTRPFLYSEYSTSISNAHQLQLMAYDLSASYTLSRDIDASETDGSNTSGMWTSSGFSPVGSRESLSFSGSLIGQDHVISGLSIQRSGTDYVGLFGATSSTASISGVSLTAANIRGSEYVGGLVGHNSAAISDSNFSGTVRGDYEVGGLVGKNYAEITNAYSTGTVYGSAYVGGLVGYNNGAVVIRNSFSTAAVSGDVHVGGLLGYNDGQVIDSYASGAVSGADNVGGVLGTNSGLGILTRVYATGSVSGNSYVGGLLGFNNGKVNASFWLLGNSSTGIAYNTGNSENVVDSLTKGLSSSEVQSANTFLNAGWSLASSGGSTATWRIYEASTTPLLRNFLTALTVTADSTSKVYDGSTVITAASSYSLSDASADTSLILGTASYDNATGSKNVGSYTLGMSGLYSSQLGYDLTLTGSTATITAATLSVTGTTTAADKTYDRSTAATVSGGTVTGLGSDDVSLSQNGSFSDWNVGSSKTVNYTNSLTGADAGNYVLASGSTSGTTTAAIIAKAITGAIVADGKTYDGLSSATTSGTLDGVISGDTVALTTSGSFADKNAGTSKTVSVTGSLSGTDAGNYTLTSNSTTTATISAKAISGSIVADDKTYDGTISATTSGTLDGVISGDTVSLTTSGSFADKNAGTAKTVSATGSLSGTDAGNYTLTSNATTTATISAKAITGSIVADDKTYDGTTSATTSGTLDGVIDGDTISLATSGNFTDKNAGTAKTVNVSGSISGTDAGNYTLSSNSTTTATISQAALTITANNDSKTADGWAYSGGNGVNYSGWVAGESSSVLGGSLSYGGTAQGAITAGSYTVTASGLSSGNYRISYVDGTLLITADSALNTAQQQAVQQATSLVSVDTADTPAAATTTRVSTTDPTTGLPAHINRQSDGGLQFPNGLRLLRVANGGLAVPTTN